MFRYGRMSGYMGIGVIVLSALPLVVAAVMLPQMPDVVPMGFNSAGEVTTYEAKYLLLFLPVIGFLLGVGSIATAQRRAAQVDDSDILRTMTYQKIVKSGLFTAILINVLNAYLFFSSYTGIGFALF